MLVYTGAMSCCLVHGSRIRTRARCVPNLGRPCDSQAPCTCLRAWQCALRCKGAVTHAAGCVGAARCAWLRERAAPPACGLSPCLAISALRWLVWALRRRHSPPTCTGARHGRRGGTQA